MESYETDFDLVGVGDLIWARRYKNEEEMSSILEGHREGPFLVVGREYDKLICLYCSSTYSNKRYSVKKFLLEDKSLSMNKDTYVQCSHIKYISRQEYIRKVSSLSLEDQTSIFKIMGIALNKGFYDESIVNVPEIKLGIGDIVLCNGKNYLILEEKDNKFLLFPLSSVVKGSKNNIKINDEILNIDFYHPSSKSKSTPLQRIDFVDNETLRKVLFIYKSRLSELKNKDKMQRGSLIRIDDRFYYIFGEYENKFMVFSVFSNINKYMCKIVINSKNFYTDFANVLMIEKNSPNMSLLYNATSLEMDEIKYQRKRFVKPVNVERSNQDWYQKVNNPSIKVGSVCKILNKDDNDLYVVIVRTQDEVIAIPLNQVINGEYKKLYKLNVLDLLETYEMVGMNLKEILVSIQDIADGFINKRKLRGMIKSLSLLEDK